MPTLSCPLLGAGALRPDERRRGRGESRAGSDGRRARLPPVLAGRAPQHAGGRRDQPTRADRAGGRGDEAPAGRLRWRHAAQPRAAGGRRAVRAARGGVPRSDRPGHRSRTRHRPRDVLRAAARRWGSDRRGGVALPGVRRQHPGDDGTGRGGNQRGRSPATPCGPRRWRPAVPQIWLLGSSDYWRGLAAEKGMPYVFAHHFSGSGTAEALELYRSTFRPSPALAEPRTVPHRQRRGGRDRARMPSGARCPTS